MTALNPSLTYSNEVVLVRIQLEDNGMKYLTWDEDLTELVLSEYDSENDSQIWLIKTPQIGSLKIKPDVNRLQTLECDSIHPKNLQKSPSEISEKDNSINKKILNSSNMISIENYKNQKLLARLNNQNNSPIILVSQHKTEDIKRSVYGKIYWRYEEEKIVSTDRHYALHYEQSRFKLNRIFSGSISDEVYDVLSYSFIHADVSRSEKLSGIASNTSLPESIARVPEKLTSLNSETAEDDRKNDTEATTSMARETRKTPISEKAKNSKSPKSPPISPKIPPTRANSLFYAPKKTNKKDNFFDNRTQSTTQNPFGASSLSKAEILTSGLTNITSSPETNSTINLSYSTLVEDQIGSVDRQSTGLMNAGCLTYF